MFTVLQFELTKVVDEKLGKDLNKPVFIIKYTFVAIKNRYKKGHYGFRAIYSCHTFIEAGLNWRNLNSLVNIHIDLIGSLFRCYSPFCNELSAL